MSLSLVRSCGLKDTLPEWSKGVDSSSTSASCVGSNPTGVMSIGTVLRVSLCGTAATFWESTSVDDGAAVGRAPGRGRVEIMVVVEALKMKLWSQGHFARVV